MDEGGYVKMVQDILDKLFALPGVTAVRFGGGYYTYTGHPKHEKHSIPLAMIKQMNIAGYTIYVGESFVRFMRC